VTFHVVLYIYLYPILRLYSETYLDITKIYPFTSYIFFSHTYRKVLQIMNISLWMADSLEIFSRFILINTWYNNRPWMSHSLWDIVEKSRFTLISTWYNNRPSMSHSLWDIIENQRHYSPSTVNIGIEAHGCLTFCKRFTPGKKRSFFFSLYFMVSFFVGHWYWN
jgi:hypothetical protein